MIQSQRADATLQTTVPFVTLSEVCDEVLKESEVKVIATAKFENCPDEQLSEDYFISLRKFILSENHLERNISHVKANHLESRTMKNQLYFHRAVVEINVRLANLWEPPEVYIRKHLIKNDWLRGNKTRITLEDVHVE